MSRRREASDLARALLLSTQEANFTQHKSPYLFSSDTSRHAGGSDASREMEMRPVIGGVVIHSATEMLGGVGTVDPRDVMPAPESSVMDPNSSDMRNGITSGHTEMTDEIRSFSTYPNQSGPHRLHHVATAGAISSDIPPLVPASSNPDPAHGRSAVHPPSSDIEAARVNHNESLSLSRVPPIPSTEKSSTDRSSSRLMFSPTQTSGAGNRETPVSSRLQGRVIADLEGVLRSASRPGSAALPLEVLSSPTVRTSPRNHNSAAKTAVRSFVLSDDEMQEMIEVKIAARDKPTDKDASNSGPSRPSKSAEIVRPSTADKGRRPARQAKSTAMAGLQSLADLQREARALSPDPLHLGDEPQDTVEGRSKQHDTKSEEKSEKSKGKQKDGGFAADKAADKGKRKDKSTRRTESSSSTRKPSARAQGLEAKRLAGEEALRQERRANKLRDKQEREEAERTGRDLKEIQKERKAREEAEQRAAAKLRRRSPDTEDEDEEEKEEVEDVERMSKANEKEMTAVRSETRMEKVDGVKDSMSTTGISRATTATAEDVHRSDFDSKTQAGTSRRQPISSTAEVADSLNRALKTDRVARVESNNLTSTQSANTASSPKPSAVASKSKAKKTKQGARRRVESDEEPEAQSPAVSKSEVSTPQASAVELSSKPRSGKRGLKRRIESDDEDEEGASPSAVPGSTTSLDRVNIDKNTSSLSPVKRSSPMKKRDAETVRENKLDVAVIPSPIARSPLKALPARVNAVPRHSPGPLGANGTPLKPGGIAFKTERSDLAAVLSKFPGSRLSGMSRRIRIAPLHQKIGPPKKELPPAPTKKEKRKKGESDEEDEDEAGDEDEDDEGGGGAKRGKKAKGIEWFMVEDDGF